MYQLIMNKNTPRKKEETGLFCHIQQFIRKYFQWKRSLHCTALLLSSHACFFFLVSFMISMKQRNIVQQCISVYCGCHNYFLYWAGMFNWWMYFSLVLILPYTKYTFWNHTLLYPPMRSYCMPRAQPIVAETKWK